MAWVIVSVRTLQPKSTAMRACFIAFLSATLLTAAGATTVSSQVNQETGQSERPTDKRQVEQESLSHNADRPVDAQECSGRFNAADINNDGSLNRNEIGNARSRLPTELANKSAISRNEFMVACSGT
jgi:hypothetical protein